MSKPALPPPSPTHLGRLITRCPKGIHTAVVFSRACDTRAHPWTFALFAFTTFTEKRKIRTIFNPKTEDKNRAKKCPTLPQKRPRFSQKRRRFLEKRGRFSRKCRTFFLKHSEILPTQPRHFVLSATKIEGKSPISLKLPSFHLLFSIASTENPSVILCPKIPHFSPRFPLFKQHSLNVC